MLKGLRAELIEIDNALAERNVELEDMQKLAGGLRKEVKEKDALIESLSLQIDRMAQNEQRFLAFVEQMTVKQAPVSSPSSPETDALTLHTATLSLKIEKLEARNKELTEHGHALAAKANRAVEEKIRLHNLVRNYVRKEDLPPAERSLFFGTRT